MNEPNGSKRFPVLGVCAFLAVGFVALLASGNPPHSASAASGGGAEMVLTLPSHDNCDDPDQPTICTLATGTTFTVSVDLLNPPPVGYISAQVWIQYDSQGLVYKPLLSGLLPPLPPTTTKVIWPDAALDTITNIFDPVNHVAAGGATTGVFSPPASFYSAACSSSNSTARTVRASQLWNCFPLGQALPARAVRCLCCPPTASWFRRSAT